VAYDGFNVASDALLWLQTKIFSKVGISMHILITGGAGFIGANLARMLLDQGHELTIFDDFSTGEREHLLGLPIQIVQGSILDVAALDKAISDQEAVVHLAAQTGVPGSLIDPQRDCHINVFGTLNVLEAARKCGSGLKFVFASSNAPLGRQPPPATEEKAPLPISPYGASKLAGEAYCLAYYGSWGMKTIVLRFGNVYGPFSMHKSSVIAKFFKEALACGQITVDGDGGQTRDFLYVGDLCRAVLVALGSEIGGEVFQVATGIETSILELAAMVKEVASQDVEIAYATARQGDIRKNYSGISKINRMLNWQPRTGLREGLETTWRWFGTAASSTDLRRENIGRTL
jgi:UDP-glucose 4-epimerase